MYESHILSKVRKHCSELIHKSRCYFFPFHNWNHTSEVFKNVYKIGRYESIEEELLEPLLIAALFHDTGTAVEFKEHEKSSAINAHRFLRFENYPQQRIEVVVECIMATRMPQNPQNILQEILCDADLMHLGTDSFFRKNRQLRKEWAQYLNKQYSDMEWYALNVRFLEGHSYHTGYARKHLEPVKHENLKILKSLLTKTQEL